MGIQDGWMEWKCYFIYQSREIQMCESVSGNGKDTPKENERIIEYSREVNENEMKDILFPIC